MTSEQMIKPVIGPPEEPDGGIVYVSLEEYPDGVSVVLSTPSGERAVLAKLTPRGALVRSTTGVYLGDFALDVGLL